MSVYVHPMINQGKRIGRAGPHWCHMIADTLDELHEMAGRIGLKRAWFQNHGSTPHYDIGTERIRALAIKFGAIDCERGLCAVTKTKWEVPMQSTTSHGNVATLRAEWGQPTRVFGQSGGAHE